MGVFDNFNPPLGSQLIFELYGEKDSNNNNFKNYYVKLIYNGKVVPLSDSNRVGGRDRRREKEREREGGEEGLVSLEFFLKICGKMSISQEEYLIVCEKKEEKER